MNKSNSVAWFSFTIPFSVITLLVKEKHVREDSKTHFLASFLQSLSSTDFCAHKKSLCFSVSDYETSVKWFSSSHPKQKQSAVLPLLLAVLCNYNCCSNFTTPVPATNTTASTTATAAAARVPKISVFFLTNNLGYDFELSAIIKPIN